MTYPFPNFNGWESIRNFIPHFTGQLLHIHAGIDFKLCL